MQSIWLRSKRICALGEGKRVIQTVIGAVPVKRAPSCATGPLRAPELDVKDDDIALSEAALEGADLWLEEPRFTRAFFISDRLARDLSLKRCLITPLS